MWYAKVVVFASMCCAEIPLTNILAFNRQYTITMTNTIATGLCTSSLPGEKGSFQCYDLLNHADSYAYTTATTNILLQTNMPD